MNTIISILMIVTGVSNMTSGDKTGVWLEEFAVPYVKFKKEGFEVTVATINGGETPIDPSSLEGVKPEWKDAMDALKNTKKLDDVDSQKYTAVYVPGGHGAMFDLAEDKVVKEILAEFADAGKVVSAVCHGPAALVGVKLKSGKYLVDGKKLTSFTNSEEDEVKKSDKMPFMLESKLVEQGGIFQAKGNWADNVVTDGNLITGQNPSASNSIADEIIKKLKLKQ